MTLPNGEFTWADGERLDKQWRTVCESRLEAVKTRISGLEETTKIRLEAIERAVIMAKEEQERRWQSSNEFRASLSDAQVAMKDLQKGYLTRVEYEVQHTRLSELVKALELSKAELQGKASQESVSRVQTSVDAVSMRNVIAIAISFLSIMVGVLLHFIR